MVEMSVVQRNLSEGYHNCQGQSNDFLRDDQKPE